MQRILDAAAEVFAEDGYDVATTNAISARAGVSPGSLYQFFPNKAAIGEALALRYVAELERTHERALGPDDGELSLEQLIARIVGPLVRFNVANPAAHKLLHGADVSPNLAEVTAQLNEAVLRRTEALIRSRFAELSPARRRRVARVVVQIFKGVLPSVLSHEGRSRRAYVRELELALTGYLGAVDPGA